jgi:hypothetical protein
MTHRWREVDSNFWSLSTFMPLALPNDRNSWARSPNDPVFIAGLMVRIRFPPPERPWRN